MFKRGRTYKNYKWTPEIAYAVGLITTDGCLSKNGRNIDFTSKEKNLIELFRGCLHLKNKIGKKSRQVGAAKKYYRIQFGNIVFYHWLQKIGLHPRKSKTIGALNIPDRFLRDFLRGHLDGDGSIWSYQDSWNTFKSQEYVYIRLWTRFYSASKTHILWIRKRITQILGIKGHIWGRKTANSPQNSHIWELKFAKKESMKLLTWLYYDINIPCLQRKRKVAEKFINP